jgi:hypothetical protein
MTPTQIQECFARAQAVINGEKPPSEQNARDVVTLLKHYVIQKPPEKAKSSAEMPDFFKGLFR